MASKCNIFLALPDDLLYLISNFIAGPTDRASVFCQSIIPLSSSIRQSIKNERPNLWSMILNEYTKKKSFSKETKNVDTKKKQNSKNANIEKNSVPIRSSKRLKRNGIQEQVQDCHRLLIDRTYIAYYALSEMIHSSRTPLSLKNLRWIFRTYGPIIKCNQYQNTNDMKGSMKRGETFLTTCCRARHVKERVILSCAKELIEKHGARLDISNKGNVSTSSPLCIAAARGMSSVVKYFISAGASIQEKGTDSIQLLFNRKKRIRGTYTPLEFAIQMHDECLIFAGLDINDKQEWKGLKKCISILEKAKQIEDKNVQI